MSAPPPIWPTEALKRRVRFAYGDSLASENRNDGDVPVFGSNGVVGAHDRAITRAPAIVIGRKGSSGRVVWSDAACFPIDTTYFVDQSQTRENMRWLFYALESLGLDKINFDSAVPGLSRELAYSLPLVFPPVSEQQRIAAYLDASCAAIDAAVAAKRRQLETLDALRGSIIETAVTRGTNAQATFQQIDHDWIGALPEHWTATRIKRVISRVDYGISVSSEQEGRYPVLKMGNIQAGAIVFSKMEFVDDVAESLLLETNDLLYNRTNSPDQVGKAALFRGNIEDGVTFASYLVRLRANHRITPEFLNYAVNCGGFLSYARRLAIPSVQQSNLNSTRYCRLLIPLPPVAEQIAICEHLKTKIGELTRVVSVIESQISTLTAYRKSLIHECVTGQRRIIEAEVRHTIGRTAKTTGAGQREDIHA